MTVAKKPWSCQQRLPAWPIPLRSWSPPPTPLLHPFPGREGCSGREGSWGQLAGGPVSGGLKVTQECAGPELQVGSKLSL